MEHDTHTRKILPRLLEKRGMDMATLSRKIEKNPTYIQQYLTKGTPKRLDRDLKDKIAAELGESPAVFHEGPISALSSMDHDYVEFKELDIRVGAGGGTLTEGREEVVGTWSLPASSVDGYVKDAKSIKIIQVIGDSMIPEFLPGQRIFVDTSDCLPSPPGVFVVWDGFGLVMKRCSMVPHSDPPTVKLVSTNKAYPDYEVSTTDAQIQGRVVGKLQWT